MAKDYTFAIGTFYAVGKDFAFDWMTAHPDATREQLVDALLEGQKMLPSGIALTTAERIADRVFFVIERDKTN